jgi:hypothetical protein
VGIPSADVAEPYHLEITNESQWNYWENGLKWNSFNFACYGIGHSTDIAFFFQRFKSMSKNMC